eukprot:CAMPEP_0197044838 /NCGR_PEP_ID=MMETSP1384-20130603/20808_1 /TAXON_ID=29189 /ORGANISM="Ammonia sp." /LENGTH=228 /DNA_ID=CAMNT_0042476357 /DNA_START=50 /DNA_END=736 /DNA_ORIENTATION=-
MSQAANEWRDKLANDLEVKKLGTTENFYDAWSKDYDECLDEWGYNAPAKCAELLNKYLTYAPSRSYKILDVGAGTGLVGQELVKYSKFKGSLLFGNDLSQHLLDIAAKKTIYTNLVQWDAMNKVPYQYADNTFDAICCVGVLTYCKDFGKVFNEWIRITKPGAIIIATHRSDMMKQHKTYFDGFVATLKWKKLSHLTNQPYLPNNQNYAENVSVEYWIAQNTKKISKL